MSDVKRQRSDAAPADMTALSSLSRWTSGLNRRARTGWQTLFPYFSLLGIIIIFAIAAPRFLSFGNAVNIASQSSILLLIALGSALVILMGSIDLSVGATASLAGVLTATAVPSLGPWALCLAVLVGAGVGIVNGLLLTVVRIPSFLATLGTMSVLSGLSLIVTDGVPVGINDDRFIELASFRFLYNIPALVLWAAAAFVICVLLASLTRVGRYIYAIGGGERVAAVSGLPVQRYKFYAFMLCGCLSALGGGLLASWLQSGSPNGADGYMLSAIAAVVMGGIPLNGGHGGIGRTLLGVLVIGVLANGLNLCGVGPYVQSVIQGVVVIVAVSFSLDRSKFSIMK
ncbi:ABC transporter permease [Jiella sp. MQZ9-1]|uniref:ABC transporter permease n=1 Tax=Jiella flava TaxID=2816857 RepID=A0A939JWM1_9HYPH|nr:ABC transporter permease [Jiella flava]MBO0663187.1 ABC transporter permease [Jiella flava]MCD2471761.1 ABC transporter permease [Jiella flava]